MAIDYRVEVIEADVAADLETELQAIGVGDWELVEAFNYSVNESTGVISLMCIFKK